MLADTIAAIGTAAGISAVGIVRLSGPDAVGIADQVFWCRRPGMHLAESPSHKMIYGTVVDARGVIVDDGLAVVMHQPHSYTGEDMVELHCHGNPVILKLVLAALITFGARLATAGEFTRRAFIHGKLDLVQVEAVGDLLSANSTSGVELAARNLTGSFVEQFDGMRTTLVEFLAHVHAAIDYPEEVTDVTPETWRRAVTDLLHHASAMLQTAESGMRLRTGVDAVIVGKPNVGKSSLLNALLRTQRAIVTDVPGTTRDVIEESIEVAGVSFRLSDTAGLRDANDLVEQEGVKRTKLRLADADLVLAVFDASKALDEEDHDVISAVRDRTTIMVWNKIDLPVKLASAEFGLIPIVQVSTRTGVGIDELEQEMARIAGITDALRVQSEVGSLLTRPRQVGALQGVVRALERTQDGIRQGLPPDCLAEELEEALWHLGELTGETTPEDIVDEIFRRFCVGK